MALLTLIPILLATASVIRWAMAPDDPARPFLDLLGQDKTAPIVQGFIIRCDLHEYTKGSSGGFDGANGISLLYRENRISRVILRISNPPDYAPSKDQPVFSGHLPFGISRSDAPEDVIRKLGVPHRRPESTYLSYETPNAVFSFYRETNQLAAIYLDAPER